MPSLTSIAIRVHRLDAMVAFYSEAFQFQFHEVDVYGIRSQFGEVGDITLKLVPIRDGVDFTEYPIHQPGFKVSDVEEVIAIALKHGGQREGEVIREGDSDQGAVRDPDGNTIELYSVK